MGDMADMVNDDTPAPLTFTQWLRTFTTLSPKSISLYVTSSKRLARAAALGQQIFSEEVWAVKSRALYKTVWSRFRTYLRAIGESVLANTYDQLEWVAKAPPPMPYSKDWVCALNRLALANANLKGVLSLPQMLELRVEQIEFHADHVVVGNVRWEGLADWQLLFSEAWSARAPKPTDLALPRTPGGIFPLRPLQVLNAIQAALASETATPARVQKAASKTRSARPHRRAASR